MIKFMGVFFMKKKEKSPKTMKPFVNVERVRNSNGAKHSKCNEKFLLTLVAFEGI